MSDDVLSSATGGANPILTTTSSATPSPTTTSCATPSLTATSSGTPFLSDAVITGFDEPTPVKKKARLTSDDCLEQIDGHVYYYNRSQSILGQGVNSIVFEGRFGKNQRKAVAVKRIKYTTERDAEDTKNELKSLHSKINKKTSREVDMLELVSEVQHPNIVQFFDSYIDTDNHILYIVSEKAIGTLSDYVKESNESWRKTLKPIDVNRGVADGLEYVHSNGIVHRDLKLANIFITKEYSGMLKPVIGDFGCAKATNFSLYSQSGDSGTKGFIAPEIWKALCDFPNEPNERKYTSKSDIFSEGIVFYYSLSLGKNPFGSECNSQFEIHKGSSPNFVKLDKSRNTIAHQSLLKSMLHADPDKRPKADYISSHPAMWTDEKILSYLGGKWMDIKHPTHIPNGTLHRLEDSTIIPGGNWIDNLDNYPIAQKYFQDYPLGKQYCMYSGKEKSVFGLLKAIRNTNEHYRTDYPSDVKLQLGDYPEGHVDVWMNVCPRLLMHVYEILGP